MKRFFAFLLLPLISYAIPIEDIYQLMEEKRFDEAREQLVKKIEMERFLETTTPKWTIQLYVLLSDIDSAQNHWDLAKQDYHEILRIDPKNANAYIQLARIESWQKHYDQSIQYYDRAIELNLGEEIPYIEKARVLSWKNERSIALETYKQAETVFPEKTWITNERQGIRSIWSGDTTQAIDFLKKSVERNPENTEALFALAQAYANSEMYSRAGKRFLELMEKSPDHSSAKKSFEKLKRRSNTWRISFGYAYWDGRSNERETHIKYTSLYSTLTKPLKKKWILGLGLAKNYYVYPDEVLTGMGSDLSLEYKEPLNWGFWSAIGGENISSSPPNKTRIKCSLWKQLHDRVLFRIFGEKSALINNAGAMHINLDDRFWGAEGSFRLNDYLSYNLLGRNGYPSDGNRYLRIDSCISLNWTLWPYRTFSRIGIEWQDYRFDSTHYYSPTSYSTYYLEIGCDLSFAENGSHTFGNNHYSYIAKVRTDWDSNNQMAIKPSLSIKLDLNKAFTCQLEGALSQSYTYRDWALSLNGTYFF